MPLGPQWSFADGIGTAVLAARSFLCRDQVLTDFLFHQTRAPAFNAASKQVRTYAADAKATPTEVSSILEQRIRGVQEENSLAETGRVLSVGYAAAAHHTRREC
jgi:hypothetical protein